MAAFLVRRALEEIVDQRCADLDAQAPWANMRSKLLILRALDTAEAADRAAVAWNRLSNACHLHAFEMQPSTAEVEQLCGVVADTAAVGLRLRNRIRRAKSLAAKTLSMPFRNSKGGDSVGTPATPMKHYFGGGPNSPSRRAKASTDAALPGTAN